MTQRTWVAGVAGSWLDAANWDPPGVPQPGDMLTVMAGSPLIPPGTITAEMIELGGGPVTLEVTTVSFEPGPNGAMRIAVRGGDPDQPADAAILSHGTTRFDGQISVESRRRRQPHDRSGHQRQLRRLRHRGGRASSLSPRRAFSPSPATASPTTGWSTSRASA